MDPELPVQMKEIFTDFYKQVDYIENFINERKKELQTKAATEEGPSSRMHTRALRSRRKKLETPKQESKQVHFGLVINKRNFTEMSHRVKSDKVEVKDKSPEVPQRSSRKRVNYGLRSNPKLSNDATKDVVIKTSTKTRTAKLLDDNVSNKMDNVEKTKNKVDNAVEKSTKNKVDNAVEKSTKNKVDNAVEKSTKNKVDNAVEKSTENKTDNVVSTNKTSTTVINTNTKLKTTKIIQSTATKPKKPTIHTTTLQTKTTTQPTKSTKSNSKPTPFTSPIKKPTFISPNKNGPFISPNKNRPFISPLKRTPFISPLKQSTKTREAIPPTSHRMAGGKKRLSGRKGVKRSGEDEEEEEEGYVYVVDQSLQVSLDSPTHDDCSSKTIVYYDADASINNKNNNNSINNKNNNNVNNENNSANNKNNNDKVNNNNKSNVDNERNRISGNFYKKRKSNTNDNNNKNKITTDKNKNTNNKDTETKYNNNNNIEVENDTNSTETYDNDSTEIDDNDSTETEVKSDDDKDMKVKRGMKRKSAGMVGGDGGDGVPVKVAKVVLSRLDDEEYDCVGGKKLRENGGVVSGGKLSRDDNGKIMNKNRIKKPSTEATPYNKKQQHEMLEGTPQCDDASAHLLSLHLTNDNVRRKPSKSTPINNINPPKLPTWVHSGLSLPQCNLILSPIDDLIKRVEDTSGKKKSGDKKQRLSNHNEGRSNEVGGSKGRVGKSHNNGSFSEEFLCPKDEEGFKAPLLPHRPATKNAKVLVEPLSLANADKNSSDDAAPKPPSDPRLKSTGGVAQGKSCDVFQLVLSSSPVETTKNKISTKAATTSKTSTTNKSTANKKSTLQPTVTTTPASHTTTKTNIITTSTTTSHTTSTTHTTSDHHPTTTTTTPLETTITSTFHPISTSTPVMTSSLTSSNASSRSKTYETADDDSIFENSLTRPTHEVISIKDSVDENNNRNNNKIDKKNNKGDKDTYSINSNNTYNKVDDSLKSTEKCGGNKNNKNNNNNTNNNHNTSHNKDTSLLKQVLCKKFYSHNTTYNSAVEYHNNNNNKDIKNNNNKDIKNNNKDNKNNKNVAHDRQNETGEGSTTYEDERSIKKYNGNAFADQSHDSSCYEMTPMREKVYAPATKDNYNICDLSMMDETDDEDQPRKTVPQWAKGDKLLREILSTAKLDHEEVFQGMQCPDLAAIFKHSKRKHKFQLRSSSQYWSNTPARFRHFNDNDDLV